MKVIGIAGLGNMGMGMALSLQRKGHQVVGHARSQATRERAAAMGIRTETSVAALAAQADAIVLSLPMPADVAEVVAGPGGILENAKPGLLVIDTSTSNPELTRQLALRLGQAGLKMIDAPVSGGPSRAMDGTLTMMVGCPDALWEDAEQILQGMSARQIRIGDVGAGHIAKLANNLLLASHLAIAGEVLHLAESAGVTIAPVLEAINAGTGRSNITEHNFRTWILNNAFNSGFTTGLMRKDVRLGMDLMASLGLDLPVTGAIARRWDEACEALGASDDFNRIVEVVKQPAKGAATQAQLQRTDA